MSAATGWRHSPWLLLVARLVAGGMFIHLGAAKLDDQVTFLKLIRQYDIVETPWVLNAIAAWVPWLEIWFGALLVVGAAVRGTALVMLAMVVAFTLAVHDRGSVLAAEQGLSLCEVAFDCGCGTGVVNVCRKLAENVGLAVLLVIAVLSGTRRWCLQRAPRDGT